MTQDVQSKGLMRRFHERIGGGIGWIAIGLALLFIGGGVGALIYGGSASTVVGGTGSSTTLTSTLTGSLALSSTGVAIVGGVFIAIGALIVAAILFHPILRERFLGKKTEQLNEGIREGVLNETQTLLESARKEFNREALNAELEARKASQGEPAHEAPGSTGDSTQQAPPVTPGREEETIFSGESEESTTPGVSPRRPLAATSRLLKGTVTLIPTSRDEEEEDLSSEEKLGSQGDVYTI